MVGIAHGTRIAARTRPRPRNALLMMTAMATPMIVSATTQTTVKNVVFKKALTRRSMLPNTPMTRVGLVKMLVKLDKPTNCSPDWRMPVLGSMPLLLANSDSRTENRMGKPTTRVITSMVGETRAAARAPCPSLSRFFLRR